MYLEKIYKLKKTLHAWTNIGMVIKEKSEVYLLLSGKQISVFHMKYIQIVLTPGFSMIVYSR